MERDIGRGMLKMMAYPKINSDQCKRPPVHNPQSTIITNQRRQFMSTMNMRAINLFKKYVYSFLIYGKNN